MFFGSGDVALETVKLLDQRRDIVKDLNVVCPPQKSSRSPIPVRDYANEKNIGIYTYDPLNVTDIAASIGPKFDMGVVVDFGYLIPQSILNQFATPPILMHPSLLPKYRGAAPIEHALMNGEKETGITVLEVHPTQFDKGKMLLQKKFALKPTDTIHQIRNFLAVKGAEAIIECLSNYDHYVELGKVQDDHGMTKAPKIKKSDYAVDLNQKAVNIYNLWRGLGKLTTTLHGCQTIRSQMGFLHVLLHDIFIGRPKEHNNMDLVGGMLYDKDQKVLWVRCQDDENWIGVHKLQIQGKNTITAQEFNNAVKVNLTKSLQFK